MPGRNLRIGRIAGIPVGISPWWLVIVALLTWSVSAEFDALAPVAAVALALGAVLCLFAGILAHEFGHALVARRAGIEIEEIDLWLLGGVARMRSQPRRAGDGLRFALAGPAVTVALALAFGAATAALGPGTLRTFVAYQAQINAALAAFNLLPALPLDGGRVARAAVARHGRLPPRDRDRRPRRTVDGLRPDLPRRAGHVRRVRRRALAGDDRAVPDRRRDRRTAPGRAHRGAGGLHGRRADERSGGRTGGLDGARGRARRDRPYAFTTYPVVGADGELLGLFEARLATGATAATVGQACDPDRTLMLGVGEPAAALLDNAAFLAHGRAVVVDGRRRPLGVISITDLERRRAAMNDCAAPRRHGPAGVQR